MKHAGMARALTHKRYAVHALAALKLTFYCEGQKRPDSDVAPLTQGDWVTVGPKVRSLLSE
jgi:hypothetical protein